MKLRKIISIAAAGVLSLSILAGCGGDKDAAGGEKGGKVSWRLASNHPEEHPVTPSLREFTEIAKEKTDGSVNIELHPNGLLGQERDVIELVKSGTIEMAKVSASALEGFDESYSIFSLPYVFESQEHFYNVMDNSKAVKEIFEGTKDDGWFAIGWYSAGGRSIYTKNKKVETPEDMKGLKIRVQESPTSISMIRAMGGSATPMAFGEVYTALQQGIIDGAENNEMGLTANKHGEVAKQWSYTEHQFVPDVLIINTKAWDKLSEEQQKQLMEAVKESSEAHKVRWDKAVKEALTEAQDKMGVTINYIDNSEFIKAAKPLHNEYKNKSTKNAEWFEDFQSYAADKE